MKVNFPVMTNAFHFKCEKLQIIPTILKGITTSGKKLKGIEDTSSKAN